MATAEKQGEDRMAAEPEMMQLAFLNLSRLPDAVCRDWLGAVLGDGVRIGSVDSLEALPDTGCAILIYDAPEVRIAPALRDGMSLTEASAGWRDQARAILARWRQGRRRLFLADADALVAAPEALAERLAAWLERPAGATPAAIGDGSGVSPARDIHDILAAHAAMTLASLRDLADEMEAAGLSPRLARSDDPEQLAAIWKTVELEREQTDLLQLQLKTAQQALEQEYRDRITDRDVAAAELERLRKAAELERLRLETALTEQARQIAALLDGHRALMVERGELQAGLTLSRHEIDALFASTSWKVTAPLRRARLAVTGSR
ncbi:hypothetical protein I5535_18695 [Rhodobacteraceae bacterium F11138]|nr:hypothetical protein [Rhodobacteraceae bacterium F11138]